MSTERDHMSTENDELTVDVSDAALEALRAVIRHTDGPASGVIALSVALAAMQQYMLSEMPESHPLLVHIATLATRLPADVGAGLVREIASEIHAEQCPGCRAVANAVHAKPYGEA